MKRTRLILALLLTLALTFSSTIGLAASKDATTKPTVKITVPKGTKRGGLDCDLTITPSMAGFLTLRLLDENGVELAVICENQEVHTKANTITVNYLDANGNALPAGEYTLSAVVVSQYGLSSKETTADVELGSPRPALTDVSVTTSTAFNPTLSFYASFDDKSASVTLSLSRLRPQSAYFGDFPEVTLSASGASSTTINLLKDNPLPTAAGYYQVKGALVEAESGISSEQLTVDFVVDVNGAAYLLDEAPAETLLALDSLISDFEAGKLTSGGSTAPATDSTSSTSSSSSSSASSSSSSTSSSSSGTTSGTQNVASTTLDGMSYTAGTAQVGPEGLQIGVGVSDTAEQEDAGYWGLTASSSNEEIWAALTRDMIGVDVAENESAYIYDSTEEGRKALGTVSGLSHGLNVIQELDNDWSLVEAYRTEDGAFVRGYIRTNKLRVVEPNTTYGIVIDKATQTLTVWKDGAPIGSCLVSTGLPTTKYPHRETPAGEFITVTRHGTTEYYGMGYCKYTIRISGGYRLSEIPTTKKNGSDFSMLEGSLGQKATRGNVCIAHDASTDGGINAEWIWNMTTENKKVKVLIFDDKDRSLVPVSE